MIMEEASESTSESSSSLGLSELLDELSDEEEVDISESWPWFGRDRSSNTPRPRFCVSEHNQSYGPSTIKYAMDCTISMYWLIPSETCSMSTLVGSSCMRWERSVFEASIWERKACRRVRTGHAKQQGHEFCYELSEKERCNTHAPSWVWQEMWLSPKWNWASKGREVCVVDEFNSSR